MDGASPLEAAGCSGAAGIAVGDYRVLQPSAADLALPDRYVRDELFFPSSAGRTLSAINVIDMDRDSSGAGRASKVSHLVKAWRSLGRHVAC